MKIYIRLGVIRPKCTRTRSTLRAVTISVFPSSLWIVFRPWLPVRFPLFGNQLQEMGMTRVEREGRVYINPLDLSCVIPSLQRQLAHAVACGNNKDVSGCCRKRDNVWGNCSKFLNGTKIHDSTLLIPDSSWKLTATVSIQALSVFLGSST